MAADEPSPDSQGPNTLNVDGVAPCTSKHASSNQDADLPANLLDRITSLDLSSEEIPHGARASSKPSTLEHASDSMPAVLQDQTEHVQQHDATLWDAKGKVPETRSDIPGPTGLPTAHPSHETEDQLRQTRPTIDCNDPDCGSKSPDSALSIDGFQDIIREPESSSQLTTSLSSLGEGTTQKHPLTDTASAADTSALTEAPLSSEQKGKQKATDIEPVLGPAVCAQETSGENDAQKSCCPSANDPEWERSAERAPQKLPILFIDAYGRKYLFPWEKAKQWKDMEMLIRQCLSHDAVIGPRVQVGHYDLRVNLPYEVYELQAAQLPVAPSTGPSTASASTSSVTTVVDSAVSAASTSTAAQLPGANYSNALFTSQSKPMPMTSFIIPPELWDDTVVPGMLVTQHMWQIPQNAYFPPYFPGGRGRGIMTMPGRGRGRGRGTTANGTGGGRGMPTGAVTQEMERPRRHKSPVPRGKTKRRLEGM
ncbi:hypothetical protein F5Y18DRAFT_368057 [Xylariaceae sp. FL1019]|nr:hypothetical protein F5Y18DRAFT_368057 [Xylariaceae sp. FL1019]